jgi:autotransporter-associated beta strand protein
MIKPAAHIQSILLSVSVICGLFVRPAQAQSPGELTVDGGIVEVNDTRFLSGDAFALDPEDLAFESTGQRNALVVFGGGTLSLKDGADVTVANTNNLTAFLRVGYGTAGTLVIENGASLAVGSATRYANVHIGQGVGAVGQVTQTGGAFTSIGSFNVGVNGGDGTYTISGGTLTFDHAGPLASNRTTLISIGFNNSVTGTSTGNFNIEGGLVELKPVQAPAEGEAGTNIGFIIGNRALNALQAYSGTPVNDGNAAAGNGTVTQTGGIFRVGAGAGLYLSGYGNGVYNLDGGILEIGGDSLHAQYGNHAEYTYAFNLGGGTIRVTGSELETSVDANLVAGQTSVVDTNGLDATWAGNLSAEGLHQIDFGGSALVKTGAGTLMFTGQSRVLDTFAVTGGAAGQTAGATSAVEFMVGSGTGSTVAYEMNGGTLVINPSTRQDNLTPVAGSFRVGDFGGTGTFTQTAGTVTVEDNGALNIGNQGGAGTYNLEGGTLVLKNGLHVVGRSDSVKPASQGVLNIDGGTLAVRNAGSLFLGNNVANANSGFSGTLNQSGGVLHFDEGTKFYLSAFTEGTYNFTGGILEIGGDSFRATYNGHGDGGAFHFGGGTIRVTGTDLVTAVAAILTEGTADTGVASVIDTNGLNMTWSGGITGAQGGLIKTGAGNLTLNGNGLRTIGYLNADEGTLLHSAGTTTVTELVVGSNYLAKDGTFILSAGTINLTGSTEAAPNASFRIGDWGGTGHFSQTGGTINADGAVNIGNRGGTGTYALSGGTLNIGENAAGDTSALVLGRSRAGDGEAVSSGTFNATGGTLHLFAGAPLLIGGDTFPVADSGNGQGVFNQSGTARVIVDSYLSLGAHGAGTYNLSGGTLEIGGAQGIRQGTGTAHFNLSGGTLKVIGSDLTTTVRATLADGTTSAINTNGFNATFANGLAGAGGFDKTGGGTLILNGGTDLQAASTVSGVLKVGAGSGKTGTLNLTDDLTVTVTDGVSRLQVGVDGGTGTATLDAGASFTIDDSAAASGWGTLDVGRGAGSTGVFNHTAGTVDMSGGALQIGYSGGNGTYHLGEGAELVLGEASTVFIGSGAGATGLMTIAEGAVFTAGSQIFIGAGEGATGTIQQTGGTVTLTGPIVAFGTDSDETSHDPGKGVYNIEAGTLVLDGIGQGVRIGDSADGGVGEFNQSGGTVTVTGTTLRVGAHGSYTQTGGVLEIGGTNLTGNGAYLFGGGKITVTGSALISGMNATLAAGKILTVDTNGLGATFGGSFTGAGSLTKTGLGVLRMTGESDYTGVTRVENGALRVDGILAGTRIEVANGASLAGHGTVADVAVESGGQVGFGDNVGSFTATGDFSMETGSHLLLRIAGLALNDHLDVGGTFFAGGLLEVVFVDEFDPVDAASFDLFDASTFEGSFAQILLPTLATGLEWDLGDLYTDGIIAVQLSSAVPEPAAWPLAAGLVALTACLFRRRRMRR